VFPSIKSSRGLVGMGSLTAVLGDGKAAVAMIGEMVPSGLVAEDGGLALTRAFEQEGRNRDKAVAAEKKAWESSSRDGGPDLACFWYSECSFAISLVSRSCSTSSPPLVHKPL
jgi:hypothetical protein